MAYTGKKSGRKSRRGNAKRAPQAVDRILQVVSLGRHGDGVATEDGAEPQKSWFVPFALPGERVRVAASGSRGDLLEVLEPSAERVDAFCPHYLQCGGCTAQHMSGALYRDWKRGVLETAFRNQQLAAPIDEMIDAHGDGRRRVTVHVEINDGHVRVGFMQARTSKLVKIEACPILAPGLGQAFDIAGELAVPFAPSHRRLDIALTEIPEGLDCDIQGTDVITYDIHVALAELAEKWDLARITLDGVIELERRKPMLRIGDVRVPLPAASFLQATETGEATLARLVLAEVKGAARVADLFCGVGPFALRLARMAAVYAADSNAVAVTALEDGVRHAVGLKQVETEVRDLFRNPLYRDDLDAFDAVILNPARAGAQAQSEEIARSEVPVVVYVSCDPATLARDASLLEEGGYQLVRLTPVDQFKYASHIEAVAVFHKS